MNSPGKTRRNKMLYPVVILLGVAWMVGFDISVGGPPEDPAPSWYVNLVAAALFIAGPWYTALYLLLRDRPEKEQAEDLPATMLAAAVSTLPAGRREWGAAMTAELAQVQERGSRWRFAAGCARTALIPPQSSRSSMLVVAALSLVGVVAAGLATGAAIPEMRVFAVVFAGLVGSVAVLAVARSRSLRPRTSAPSATVVGLAGVAACVGVTGWFLSRYPIGSLHLRPVDALFLAISLTACLGLTLFPPRGLNTDRLPQRVAVVLALALAGGLVVASRLGVRGIGGFDSGIFGYVFGMPMAALFAGSLVAALVRRSFRSGAQAAAWIALLTTPAFYAIALMESVRWYENDTSLIYASDTVPIEAVGENIRNFMWGLILLPVWWIPFGIFGAAIGSARWLRRRSSSRA